MDDKTITGSLAASLGRDTADVTALLDSLAAAMKERLCDMDTIAIPGFGEFEPVKDDEKIVADPESGRNMLMPPSITVRFNPSSLLKRKIKETR